MTRNSIIANRIRASLTPWSTYCIGVSWWADSILLCRQLDITVKTLYRHCKITLIVCNYDHWIRDWWYDRRCIEEQFWDYHIEYWRYNGTWVTEWELRDARYARFQKMYFKYNASWLFLGHTLTDRVEWTILAMQWWGTVQWVLWMSYESNRLGMRILRPLIWCSKWQIYTHALKTDLQRSEDCTNADTTVSNRNNIRALLRNNYPSLYLPWYSWEVDSWPYYILQWFYSNFTVNVNLMDIITVKWTVKKGTIYVYKCQLNNDGEVQQFCSRCWIIWMSNWQRLQVIDLVWRWSWWLSCKWRTFVTRKWYVYAWKWLPQDLVRDWTSYTNGPIHVQNYYEGLIIQWKRMSRALKKLPVPYFLRKTTLLYTIEWTIISYETLVR